MSTSTKAAAAKGGHKEAKANRKRLRRLTVLCDRRCPGDPRAAAQLYATMSAQFATMPGHVQDNLLNRLALSLIQLAADRLLDIRSEVASWQQPALVAAG